jgi:hypothetical protein
LLFATEENGKSAGCSTAAPKVRLRARAARGSSQRRARSERVPKFVDVLFILLLLLFAAGD